MKKSNLLRVLATFTLIIVAGYSAVAQYVGPTAATYETTNSDYVTIGSRVPYYVAPDPIIAAMQAAGTMGYSGFSWRFTTAANVNLTGVAAVNYDGTGTTATAQAGFIRQNEISVIWGGADVATGSTYNVRAIERSNPLSGIADGCNGDEELKNVIVLPRPTVVFPTTSAGGCGITPGAASTFYVPVNVTGLGEWQITYTVTYNGNAYIASTTTANLGTATTVTNDGTVVAEAAATKNILGTPTGDANGIPVIINGGGAASGFGYYDVTITNITDRISRKSLDLTLVAAQAGDLPGATYRIYVNPTPSTSPIQHLQNL